MLLTVLMRWPALIAVLAIGGSAFYAYEEYGIPDAVQIALYGKPNFSDSHISDSTNVSKVVDHLAVAGGAKVTQLAITEPVVSPVVVTTTTTPVITIPKETKPKILLVPKYMVKEGDSLSKIAMLRSSDPAIQRVLINRMFHDNPLAFNDGDPDQLRADAVIIIPAR